RRELRCRFVEQRYLRIHPPNIAVKRGTATSSSKASKGEWSGLKARRRIADEVARQLCRATGARSEFPDNRWPRRPGLLPRKISCVAEGERGSHERQDVALWNRLRRDFVPTRDCVHVPHDPLVLK